MPVHVASVRRVKPGQEEAFQAALREFFRESFARAGVHGASLILPAPGSDSREHGILRSFATQDECDAFYASPDYRRWLEESSQWTEGEVSRRPLTGLEAWFRAPGDPPPRWKLALATLVGVFPTSLFLGETVAPLVHSWPFLLRSLIFASAMVALLTWVVMPLVTRVLHSWLHPKR